MLVEDDEDDFLITRDLLAEIDGARFEIEWAPDYETGKEKVLRQEHDVYLLDYRLGDRTGLQLLQEAVGRGCRRPMILFTGKGDHQVDVEAMRAGAADFLVKGQVSSPLLERSIRYSLDRARNLAALQELQQKLGERVSELEKALSEVKQLRGLLPICSYCKRVRDDRNYWQQVEGYISERSEVTFTHSYCPDCVEKIVAEEREKGNLPGA